ncbi:putative transmembrane cell adhesion receptor mua-3 [Trichinella spiralis]|uniref:putative transmembrane cell adhesion receptor mua-3 n=1 Tax=Trichinella spiralis TaxID=6334 RepID=UPI0001EFC0BE|nr:putative transmembrane cell adhesion receptor mua-3 [Trichinella spiralis]
MSMSVRRHFDDVIDWSLLAAYHLSDQQISLCSLLVNVAIQVTVSTCLPDQFRCLNGEPQCIRLDQVSDGKINCQDGSDEECCLFVNNWLCTQGCPLGYFVCEDRSNCLEPKAYQDGRKDCPDGSDEPCSQGEFFCRDKSKCIDWCKFQDGIEDCADGSDEAVYVIFAFFFIKISYNVMQNNSS